MSAEDKETERRRAIRVIHDDQTLTVQEKTQRIQNMIMEYSGRSTASLSSAMSSPVKSAPSSRPNTPDPLTGELNMLVPLVPLDDSRVGQRREDGMLGCVHYPRKAMMYAKCCGRFDPCRFCHNDRLKEQNKTEVSPHELDRWAMEYMLCVVCKTSQKVAQDCANCGNRLGEYYCDVCHMWDDTPGKPVYHCKGCGVCRIGPESAFKHCDRCKACIAKESFDGHKCIERALECNCPICGEWLFTSTIPVVFMVPCGHSIHAPCYRQHISNSIQCPLCLHSLGDLTTYFRDMDRVAREHVMPDEYKNTYSRVLCNDCHSTCLRPYHFVYHKCSSCKSYNTTLVSTISDDGCRSLTNDETVEIANLKRALELEDADKDGEQETRSDDQDVENDMDVDDINDSEDLDDSEDSEDSDDSDDNGYMYDDDYDSDYDSDSDE